MKNIVLMSWYDKGANLTYTAVAKTKTETGAFALAKNYIRQQRAMGVEAIASPIDYTMLKKLVKDGVIDSEWYDPIQKKYCTIDSLNC